MWLHLLAFQQPFACYNVDTTRVKKENPLLAKIIGYSYRFALVRSNGYTVVSNVKYLSTASRP